MSRAMNVTAFEADVKAAAIAHGAVISSIEAILPSGTLVVFTNGDDAERMRRVFKDRMIVGTITRTWWLRDS